MNNIFLGLLAGDNVQTKTQGKIIARNSALDNSAKQEVSSSKKVTSTVTNPDIPYFGLAVVTKYLENDNQDKSTENKFNSFNQSLIQSGLNKLLVDFIANNLAPEAHQRLLNFDPIRDDIASIPPEIIKAAELVENEISKNGALAELKEG